MSNNNKYEPQDVPPGYPQQPQQAYGQGYNDPRGQQNYYGSPPPQGQYGQYPQQGGFQPTGPYGPGVQQQGMYYQQQPYGPQQGGYYGNQGPYGRPGGMSNSDGMCAGILGGLACCCCLDLCLL